MKMRTILLISGKRKCGKDFISERLHKRLSQRALIVRISEPIKSEWANKLQLDLSALLSDGAYKEKYRRDMIIWSDEVRENDYGYFCRAAMTKAEPSLTQIDVVIVSDIRRRNDIRWFLETYGSDVVRTLRLTSQEETRRSRGWQFTAGVDDVPSECDLDDFADFDLVMANDGINNEDQLIDEVMEQLKMK